VDQVKEAEGFFNYVNSGNGNKKTPAFLPGNQFCFRRLTRDKVHWIFKGYQKKGS
jgi:hypothetical protein